MATSKSPVTATSGGLTVVAYPGDNMVLLAFSLDDTMLSRQGGLAGFAVTRTPKGGQTVALQNRLTFEIPATAAHTPWTPTVDAPLQKFRWVDVPSDGFIFTTTYRVTPRYFASPGKNDLVDGPSVTVDVDPTDRTGWRFLVNFTRGYVASQAYVDRFHNAPIRPDGAKTIDFDAKPFETQWAWLGKDARKALYAFLAECLADTSARVDVFAYDLDEPHVIDVMCQLGKQKRLRAVLDDAPLHTKPGASEILARTAIVNAAGAGSVVSGHFGRFAHDKIFIKRGADGKAQKVLTGSANFSIRGLYVQANSIIVINDQAVARTYEDAFQTAFAGGAKLAAFANAPVAQRWYDTPEGNGLPRFSVSFAPHKDPKLSLAPVAASIQAAKSSVLFAVMDIESGGGPVLDDLRQIAAKPTIFSYGTVQNAKGLALQKPDGALGEVTAFAALQKEVPPPFKAEWAGGPGQTIHHKFVVVDFNGDDPVVYCGSSNLAQGGEGANGDNLIAIHSSALASMFAVEAVRLFDHYHFRSNRAAATSAKPLTLQGQGDPHPWWGPYYDPHDIKLRDRCLFANVSLPTGVATVKAAPSPTAPATAGKKPKPAPARPAPKKSPVPRKRKPSPKPRRKAATKKPTKKARQEGGQEAPEEAGQEAGHEGGQETSQEVGQETGEEADHQGTGDGEAPPGVKGEETHGAQGR